MDMIRAFRQMGYSKVTATPHVFFEYYPNSRTTIIERFAEVKEKVNQEKIDIELAVAAEYYLDNHFTELLKGKELLPLFDHAILVEFSMLGPTPNMHEYLFDLKINGYQPIIAHPERYLHLKEKEYKALLVQDCSFQINLLSLAGHYGREVQRKAKYLIRLLDTFYLGTDAHSKKHLDVIHQLMKSRKLEKLLKGKKVLNATDISFQD